MKTKFTFSGFDGMAVINGILTPIKATSVTMDAKGHFHYKTDKGEFTDIVLYEGQKDFERNNPKECSVRLYTDNVLVEEVLEEDGSTKMRMMIWRMVDGEPKKEWVDANFAVGQRVASVILPPNCYGTRTSCLANETYRYIDEEGNVKEKDGKIKVLFARKDMQLPQNIGYAKYIKGIVDKKSDKEFAFLKSASTRCFIPPILVKKYSLNNGDAVTSLIAYDFDKKKEMWNWICVNIKK